MLELRGVQFAYPHRVLFQNISHTTSSGQATLISGPNGAGKSTLLSVIMGFLRPTSGTVLWKGNSETDLFKSDCEFMQAENNSLFLKLNAVENLHFWLRLRGIDLGVTQIHSVLKDWGLGGAAIANLPVERFSTGMRRRLAIIRLVLSRTSLWIMDEPIYGLDTQAINLFRSALGTHLESGGLAMLVSHDRYAIDGLIHSEISIGSAR